MQDKIDTTQIKVIPNKSRKLKFLKNYLCSQISLTQ